MDLVPRKESLFGCQVSSISISKEERLSLLRQPFLFSGKDLIKPIRSAAGESGFEFHKIVHDCSVSTFLCIAIPFRF